MTKRLLILGPPGAGKGTQAVRIAERYGIPAISTGDIFRRHLADRTEIGVKVQEIIDSGGYVSDELTNEIVRDRLQEPDAENGFLLDGYPRTPGQVQALDVILQERGTGLDRVVELVADGDELIRRLLLRAQREGRSDDTEETIRRRQEIYADQTKPLIDLYSQRGLLVKVDGLGEVDEVSARVFAALGD